MIRSICCAMIVFAQYSIASDQKKPNIVIILADDLGYGNVSSLWNSLSQIPTKNIDTLASESMVFTDASTPVSWCSPTRYGLLTGVHPSRLGKAFTKSSPLIKKNQPTIQSSLKDAGYTTACIGKWHLGHTSDGSLSTIGTYIGNGPRDRGFDRFVGYMRAQSFSDVNDNAAELIYSRHVSRIINKKNVLSHLTNQAIDFINEDHQSPYFLYFAMPSPHRPYLPSKEYIGLSPLGTYGDWVIQTDAMVGKVLDAIKSKSDADNTIIIFTSDNGMEGETGQKLFAKGHAGSGPYREWKRTIYEGGTRVPFMIKWPGVIQPGRSDSMVCIIDVYETIAELIGIEAGTSDGKSFAGELLGGERNSRDYIVTQSVNRSYAIRTVDGMKLIFTGNNGVGDYKQGFQLYDLKNDIGETNNLYNLPEYADTVNRLKILLDEFRYPVAPAK